LVVITLLKYCQCLVPQYLIVYDIGMSWLNPEIFLPYNNKNVILCLMYALSHRECCGIWAFANIFLRGDFVSMLSPPHLASLF
jgi:hypothetical protein